MKKIPRQYEVYIGSPQPLSGFHFDRDRLQVTHGITGDNRRVSVTSFSQVSYRGQSGKERKTNIIHDGAIANIVTFIEYLVSAFDLIIAIDTNTKIIRGTKVSVCSFVFCTVRKTNDPGTYDIEYPFHGSFIFKGCPVEISEEKYGWTLLIRRMNSNLRNFKKRIGIVTDHDMENLALYNDKISPIIQEIYLPSNYKLMYASAEKGADTPLNLFVKECDKISSNILKEIETKGFFEHNGEKIIID